MHGVQLHQRHPQLHVREGDFAAQQVLPGGEPPLQHVQRAQQGGQRGVACRRVAAGLPGALGGPGDALVAEPAYGRDRLVGTARVEVGTVTGELPGQVAQDVGGVRADDPPGPVVAEDRRHGRTGVLVRAGLVQRTQGPVFAPGCVGYGGQQRHREGVVQAEQAVCDDDLQTVRAGQREVEPVAVRRGVVTAARVTADPAPEGRHGGRGCGGHASPWSARSQAYGHTEATARGGFCTAGAAVLTRECQA
ncbi:hypothetical protein SUDANB51_07554 [Streptomyces sp. enrichment culture]